MTEITIWSFIVRSILAPFVSALRCRQQCLYTPQGQGSTPTFYFLPAQEVGHRVSLCSWRSVGVSAADSICSRRAVLSSSSPFQHGILSRPVVIGPFYICHPAPVCCAAMQTRPPTGSRSVQTISKLNTDRQRVIKKPSAESTLSVCFTGFDNDSFLCCCCLITAGSEQTHINATKAKPTCVFSCYVES